MSMMLTSFPFIQEITRVHGISAQTVTPTAAISLCSVAQIVMNTMIKPI
jgi:hypothetical protein